MKEELLDKYRKTKGFGENYSQALQELKELVEKEQDQYIELTQTMIEETRFSQYDYDP
ncbi:MAG: hypothetical protein H7646_02635, partial [Candidatus Heimdallarchaeota archaeon]|nr:hypothetical protein [Candidatus Heimdallarchaeota archaeon]